MIYTGREKSPETWQSTNRTLPERKKREGGGKKENTRARELVYRSRALIEITSKDPVRLRTHRSIDHATMLNGARKETSNPVEALSWLLK